jgi:hypothetical protein
MTKMVGGSDLVYHGAEPAIPNVATKQVARSIMSLPKDGRMRSLLALERLLRTGYSRRNEKISLRSKKKIRNLICLQKDFLLKIEDESSESLLETYGIVTKDNQQKDASRLRQFLTAMNLTNLIASSVPSVEWY